MFTLLCFGSCPFRKYVATVLPTSNQAQKPRQHFISSVFFLQCNNNGCSCQHQQYNPNNNFGVLSPIFGADFSFSASLRTGHFALRFQFPDLLLMSFRNPCRPLSYQDSSCHLLRFHFLAFHYLSDSFCHLQKDFPYFHHPLII